jgi:hypothetical protein
MSAVMTLTANAIQFRVHPAFSLERKNTFLEVKKKRTDHEPLSRSRSAPPFDLRTSSGTVDWNANSASEKGRPGRYQRSWMEAVVPAESVAVYQTYIANAPIKPSGLTLMWHGLNREMDDSEFLEMIDGFGLDEVEFVYLPLNFWLRGHDSTRRAKRDTRMKNKGYGFVHISDARKEAEFSHKVAALSVQLRRVMSTSRATAQGVTDQLMQTMLISKARSAFRGMFHVRIKGALKSVTRFSLWQLHQKAIHRGLAKQCEPQGDESGDETD